MGKIRSLTSRRLYMHALSCTEGMYIYFMGKLRSIASGHLELVLCFTRRTSRLTVDSLRNKLTISSICPGWCGRKKQQDSRPFWGRRCRERGTADPPRSGIAGSYGNSVLKLEKLPSCFPKWLHCFAFLPAVYEGSNFTSLTNAANKARECQGAIMSQRGGILKGEWNQDTQG